MIVIGIDPGLQGYISAIKQNGEHLFSNPLNELYGNGAGHGMQIYKTLSKYNNIEHVFLERVISGQVQTAIRYGEMLMALRILNIPFTEVRAVDWKRFFGLCTPGQKNQKKRKLPTVEYAESLWPGTYFRTPNGALLDGKADACCVAEYGRRAHNRNHKTKEVEK